MTIEANLASMECHFENCIHYEEGICRDKESREYCIEIALAVLCADETKRQKDGNKS